jgi:azurin
VIRTVVEQMRYDTPTFTVASGEPVKIWFENADYSPHNLIIVEPGAGDEVGAAAEGLGAEGFARAFVPESGRILVASELLGHGKSQVLEFRAPDTAGDYEVLCTFPGHRGTMNGVMRVTRAAGAGGGG